MRIAYVQKCALLGRSGVLRASAHRGFAPESHTSMGFDLNIAVKRDALTEHSDRSLPALTSCTVITLNGTFDGAAADTVLATASDLFGKGTDSILIVMEDVSVRDPDCLHMFATGLMALRSRGIDVQVCAHGDALHAQMHEITTSRDWLLGEANVGGGRRALHLDGPESNH